MTYSHVENGVEICPAPKLRYITKWSKMLPEASSFYKF